MCGERKIRRAERTTVRNRNRKILWSMCVCWQVDSTHMDLMCVCVFMGSVVNRRFVNSMRLSDHTEIVQTYRMHGTAHRICLSHLFHLHFISWDALTLHFISKYFFFFSLFTCAHLCFVCSFCYEKRNENSSFFIQFIISLVLTISWHMFTCEWATISDYILPFRLLRR